MYIYTCTYNGMKNMYCVYIYIYIYTQWNINTYSGIYDIIFYCVCVEAIEVASTCLQL